MVRVVMMIVMLGGCWTAAASEPDHGAALLYENRPVQLNGRVERGPCPSALVFRTPAGAQYELDPRRVRLDIGRDASVTGAVYPRVSLCNAYPWLDVHIVAGAAALAPGVRPILSASPQPRLTPGARHILLIVTSIEKLREGLEEGQRVRARIPPDLAVGIGVPATPRDLMPALTDAIGAQFERLEGLQVNVIAAGTRARYLLRSSDGDRPFAAIEPLLQSWRGRMSTPGG